METNTRILTYYRCPASCTDCFFPNNCSACQEGFVLKKGVCEKATLCVGNKVLKGDIC